MVVGKGTGDFGQGSLLGKDAIEHAAGHDEQGDAEEGVDASYHLVDGEQRGQDVVGKDDACPHEGCAPFAPTGGHGAEECGRRGDEDGSDQYHEDEGEEQDDDVCGAAQFGVYQFGQACSVFSERQHTAHVVVYGSAEDAAEDDPKVGGGAEEYALNGTEDGACAGDVEELDEIDFPCGHGDVVNPILLGVAWCLSARIGSEGALDKVAVEHVAEDKQQN